MKTALFMGRFQPLHNGHMSVISNIENAQDVDSLVIAIGSAQFSNTTYNPFTADEREEMIVRSVKSGKLMNITKIGDIHDNEKWVSLVEMSCPRFDVVYSGNDLVKKLFGDRGYEIRDIGRPDMSATQVRLKMIRGEKWEDCVPEGVKDVMYSIGGPVRLKKLVCDFPNPSVTADLIMNYLESGIVLIRRKKDPFRGYWAIPGGHINYGLESVKETAVREAYEETGLIVDVNDLSLLDVYSTPGRDPRGHYVALAFYTDKVSGEMRPDDDAEDVNVFPHENLPPLAFDHARMMGQYFNVKGRTDLGSKYLEIYKRRSG